jgi:excisionase family DNA binding protein
MLAGYYTIAEAAPMVGVTRKTIHQWIKDGKICPYRVWGRSLFTLDELQPLVVHTCNTCYHYKDGVCACRDQADVSGNGKCLDWTWRWLG